MVHDGHLLGSGDWSEVVLAGSRVHPEVQKLCPATIQIVSQIEEALDCAMTGVGEVIFSRLAPGSHIKPHCASSNLRLTCHLGLEVPDGCEIRVGDEIRQWQDKKCLWFDDSFEHEVWQRSSSHRIVLLIRFWHPDIGKPNWRQAQETLNAGYLLSLIHISEPTRLLSISYAVFCLKKKKRTPYTNKSKNIKNKKE
eukprot:TRINITY_DN19449_c0_g1_i6.p1 TRINITY_DN19449_c0_g1~~TRINITY_DN19449_c0_g1_i6.p1  ORF type:complete len:196 (-),score=38.89 TRINITY_DN19449_c0_g1_i6:25-612(-)